MSEELLKAISRIDMKYIRSNLSTLLKDSKDKLFIKNIIITTLKKYNEIKDGDHFDDCEILNYIIDRLNMYIKKELLTSVLQNIRMIEEDEELSLMDYVYRHKLFFEKCDLISIFWKNKVKFVNLNEYYLTYIFEHYIKSSINDNKDDNKVIIYYIIKSCKIIELSAKPEDVIHNLIYMFKVIKKADYKVYKTIYMSFDEYEKFYEINRNTKNIKYFMIQVLFFTMLEKVNYKSMDKLMKTIIHNKELLSYLRKVLREDPYKAQKYYNINEISKKSLFINSEHQIKLNKMIDTIFNSDSTTTSIIKNNVTSIPEFIKLQSTKRR